MRGKSADRQAGEELRRAAEKLLGHAATRPGAHGDPTPEDLLHELQVHQTELELQNEELKGARVALEEARDRYLELFDFGPVGYVILDGAGRIAHVNLAGAALLGIDRAALPKRPFDALVAAADLPRWVDHVRRVKEGDAPQSCELQLRPPGRPPFPAQVTTVHTASAPDGAVGIRCAVVDITDRRRAEEERTRRIAELLELNQRLEQTQLQLLQADKLSAIGQLAAGVAHEINNPLTYVMSNLFLMGGYVDELLDPRRGAATADPGTAPPRDLEEVRRDLRQGLAESQQGVGRVSRVVRDLVTFAHRDTGRWETAEVHEMIDGALRILESGVGDSLRIVKAYCADRLELRCRPSQLGQVFLNVLVNASQAAPAGTITIRTGRTQGEAWVEFEDTGTGISPDHLHRLFEPFFTTKPVGEGTGLGLSIAHGIVSAHGGRIEVRSIVGAGSTFRIVLPVGGGDASRAEGARAPPGAGGSNGP
jgi:PAS domain S-box-containing protein